MKFRRTHIYDVALIFPAVSSNQDGTMAVEPPTSPCQNSGPLVYSRYWIAYASVPFPRLTDENRVSPSHHQRLSPPFDQGVEIAYSPYPSTADMGSPSSSSADSDLRIRSSADSDPRISPRRSMIGLDGPKVKKDRGSPMILFDENGEMHRNYYTTPTTHTIADINEKRQR